MKKTLFTLVLLLSINGCNKDDTNQTSAEIVGIVNIPEELSVYIDVEIPTNKTKGDYILIDSKGREVELVSTENIRVEESTIVSLVRKETREIIYISYIVDDDQTSGKSNKSTKEVNTTINNKNTLSCANTKVLGVASTAKFILANVLSPISIFNIGNPNRDAFYEIYKSNVLCSTFKEEQILSVENVVRSSIEKGLDFAEIASSSFIRSILEPITGGLFSDCWEMGSSLIFNGHIEFESHPYQDYTTSLIYYNSGNTSVPSVVTEFSNVIPNGIIIKDAEKLTNGNWKIKFNAYNSLPIPLGIRVGKIKVGTQFQIEPADNETNYIIKSNGISTVQLLKNGITCKGFVNNAFDSYYTYTTGGLAIRSNNFDQIEVELEFNPEKQYVLFQGPNENIRVKAYHFLEMCSHIIDFAMSLPKSDSGDNTINKISKDKIFLDLLKIVLEDQNANNLLTTNNPNIEEVFKVVGNLMVKYFESTANTAFSDYMSNNGIKKTTLLNNINIIKIGLELLNKTNYFDAWTKVNAYTSVVQDYKLYIPSNTLVVSPVTNPNPTNGAINTPLNGSLVFTSGANTPTDATYRLYYGTSNNPTSYQNLTGANYTYSQYQPNTTYYWKVETISNSGSVLATSPVWHFTTITNANLATISTTAISDITQTTATSGGNVTDNGGSAVTARGICWSTTTNPVATGSHTTDGSGSGTYSSALTGLTQNTAYYVRAYATNSSGTAYGEQKSFATTGSGTIPIITSSTISNISQSSATGGGNVTSDGGRSVTARGVCYSTSINPDLSDLFTTNGSGTGSFISSISGLSPSITYYARAYATNSIGTAFGENVSFTTLTGGLSGTVTDIDGNVYKTIKIGNQWWMAENLKSTKYNDGISIPNIIENNEWSNLTSGAYCWYDNNAIDYKNSYGALYNWYAVSSNKLCPSGWHVPNGDEWTELITFLGGDKVAGSKMKEVGLTFWNTPNTGATNTSGFSGLPGGYRWFEGIFNDIGKWGSWYISTEYGIDYVGGILVNYNTTDALSQYSTKTLGYSIRCVKD